MHAGNRRFGVHAALVMMRPIRFTWLIATAGLLAPAALDCSTAVLALERNDSVNNAVSSQYSSDAQVTSFSQFSDVRPSDWAFQALSSLIERYGCVAGYPNGAYKGSQAIPASRLPPCLMRALSASQR